MNVEFYIAEDEHVKDTYLVWNFDENSTIDVRIGVLPSLALTKELVEQMIELFNEKQKKVEKLVPPFSMKIKKVRIGVVEEE